ncbi:MAG: hypothetical protein RLZZ444_512 [Pseudomonadota bacterium]
MKWTTSRIENEQIDTGGCGREHRLSSRVIAGLMLGVSLIAAPAVQAADRTLVWADAGEPGTIDPAKANIDWELNVTRNIYDGLTTYAYGDPGTILPALATSWKQKGAVWTFKLRPDVKFHNGQAFTAEDVKASLERSLKLAQGQSYLVGDIKEIRIIDPLTVEIETQKTNVFLAGNLTHVEIYSAADIKANEADGGEKFFGENANGTGAYQFVKWDRGAQIELMRNKNWWGKFAENPYDRIIDRFVTEASTRARGLESGEFDLANYVPLDESLRISGTSGFHKVEGNYLWAWPALYLNTKLAPTDNADVRRALIKAFDFSAMNQYFQNLAITPRGPLPDWFPESPERELPVIAQDLEAAKAALAKSGLSDVTLKCVIPAGFAEFSFAATVFQASAAQIGINVQVEQAPFAEALTAMKNNTSNCFTVGNANVAPNDPTKFFSAHFVTGGFFNTANYSNPELDSLIAELPSIPDPAQRYAAVKKAAELFVGADITLWTARPTSLFAVPDRIAEFSVNPSDYTGVRFYQIGAKE